MEKIKNEKKNVNHWYVDNLDKEFDSAKLVSENNGKMKILNKSEMKKDIKKFKGKKTDKIF